MKLKFQPQKFDVNRIPGQPKKRKKVALVFDDFKRKEFLSGFRKRKLQRKKKAQEELQQQLKDEKKKIKQDARERYKNLVSQRDIPELEEFLSKNEYETENHTVSILELDVATLNKNGIGPKKVDYQNESEDEEEEIEQSDAENSEIPGMELKKKLKKTEPSSTEKPQPSTKKEMKHTLKQAALKQVQRSRAFRIKQSIERQRNKKRSKREEFKKEKASQKCKKNKQHKKLKSFQKEKNPRKNKKKE